VAKKKASATKYVLPKNVWKDGSQWTVKQGKLQRGQGNPGTKHLFRVVGEKLPYGALPSVRKHLKEELGYKSAQGVYVAHDSMGCPRYIGRGNIFQRLEARRKAQVLELAYFSFYLVSDKKHEREIETLLIRASGFLLEFNTKKRRVGISPGNIRDYEAGTLFYERHYKKGKKAKRKKKKSV
jgi:hypothetical protein